MMMRLAWILATAFALVLGVFKPAIAGYSRGGGFTDPGYGARAWGMGGAAVAIGADESAVYWNPALLSLLDGGRLGLSYVEPVPGADIRHSHLAYSRPLERGKSDEPGLGFNRHAAGFVYSNLRLEIPDGRAYSENTLLVGYAYAHDYLLSVGVSMGILLGSGDIGNFDAKGTTVNAGIRTALFERVHLGFVVRNAFSHLMLDSGEDYSLERTLTLGVGARIFENATLEGDVVSAFGGIARVVLGGEATFFSEILALRGGVSAVTAGESRVLPHMGIGIGVRRFHLNYNANFDAEEAFGNTHRFSLVVGI